MNDAPPPPTDSELAELLEVVLEQAADVAGLDSARAEAWASDVLAIAADDDIAPEVLVAALESSSGDAAAIALSALSALTKAAAPAFEGDTPVWVSAIGTNRCDGAWLLRAHQAISVAFRFIDAQEEAHVVTVDLESGPPETMGEIVLGSGDLLDALEESDADVEIEEAEAKALAERLAQAYSATTEPRDSAVVNCRLLIARLAHLSDAQLSPLAFFDAVVPDPPERDAEDDAYAIDILTRALPGLDPEIALVELSDRADASWVDASGLPISDIADAADVVAGAAGPVDLAPLIPAERDAVLTLEWADWLGAVIGLVRSGVGTRVDGEALVDAINRCPEVTSTIPKSDRDRIVWAFDTIIPSWEAAGIVSDGILTDLGVDALPVGLRRAWSH